MYFSCIENDSEINQAKMNACKKSIQYENKYSGLYYL